MSVFVPEIHLGLFKDARWINLELQIVQVDSKFEAFLVLLRFG